MQVVITDQRRPPNPSPSGTAANQPWKGMSSMDQHQLSSLNADPDTLVLANTPMEQWWRTLTQPPADGVADSHAVAFGTDPAAVLYGGLEDIHTVLTRAVAEVLQLWTDETHQPGE